MLKLLQSKSILVGVLCCISLTTAAYFVIPELSNLEYSAKSSSIPVLSDEVTNEDTLTPVENKVEEIIVTHLDTPVPLKAVYMSSWVAATPSIRDNIISMIDRTEINAVIIDVKDYSGKLSFKSEHPLILEAESGENRIKNIKALIAELHAKNIYVIARIAVFQDPHLAKQWREYALTKISDPNTLWPDDKCRREIAKGKESRCTYWVDMGAKKVWDYIVAVGRESYAIGFDELNFDYIRFPSDGNMKDISYPVSGGRIKKDVMKEFFQYLNKEFTGGDTPITPRPKISADFFGMTTTNTDDLNIGQQLEEAIPYFDYIAPMVYPSHYPPNWNGFANPAEKPYEVIKIAMQKGVDRLVAIGQDPKKLRPWLQDFDLGAIYTKDLVQAQIKATYEVGLDSWMLWDPANTYTESALLPE